MEKGETALEKGAFLQTHLQGGKQIKGMAGTIHSPYESQGEKRMENSYFSCCAHLNQASI